MWQIGPCAGTAVAKILPFSWPRGSASFPATQDRTDLLLSIVQREVFPMKKFALIAAASAAFALAGCGDADDASEDAMADTVEMPADEAMTGLPDPVADTEAEAAAEAEASAAETVEAVEAAGAAAEQAAADAAAAAAAATAAAA